MAKFQKGNPKRGGRKKGTPNRTTKEVAKAFLKLLDDNLATLQRDIDSLTPRERAPLLVNIAKHVTPPALNPERLTEEQLLQILEYLKDNEKCNSQTDQPNIEP